MLSPRSTSAGSMDKCTSSAAFSQQSDEPTTNRPTCAPPVWSPDLDHPTLRWVIVYASDRLRISQDIVDDLLALNIPVRRGSGRLWIEGRRTIAVLLERPSGDRKSISIGCRSGLG